MRRLPAPLLLAAFASAGCDSGRAPRNVLLIPIGSLRADRLGA